jgi:hypothetical protein
MKMLDSQDHQGKVQSEKTGTLQGPQHQLFRLGSQLYTNLSLMAALFLLCLLKAANLRGENENQQNE